VPNCGLKAGPLYGQTAVAITPALAMTTSKSCLLPAARRRQATHTLKVGKIEFNQFEASPLVAASFRTCSRLQFWLVQIPCRTYNLSAVSGQGAPPFPRRGRPKHRLREFVCPFRFTPDTTTSSVSSCPK